ncbi:MAG: AsmA family protein [Desulfobacteraceae bacterium]|nr:AsmA family protein [Desulfobacteraceae bacterium]
MNPPQRKHPYASKHHAPFKTAPDNKMAALVLRGNPLALILLLVALLLAPRIVSTQWSKEQLEDQASQMMHRPVRIEGLLWTWDRGILLKGLEIADDPLFSRKPIASIDRILIDVDIPQLTHGKLAFNLEVKGLHCHLIRNKNGQTNLGLLLSSITPQKEPSPIPEPEDHRPTPWFTLPFDLNGRVSMDKISIDIEDRAQEHLLSIHDASLLLNIPSLTEKPIQLQISMEQEMNGKPLPPLRLGARIEGLIDSGRGLNLKGASVNIDGSFPGFHVQAAGSLGDMGLKGRMQLDLAPLLLAVRPFLPPSAPDASGKLEMEMAASLDSENAIDFDVKLTGVDLTASGGPLRENRGGPVNLEMLYQGSVNTHSGILHIRKGEIQIQENSRLSWRGTIKGLNEPQRQTDLLIGPVSLDLDELLSLSKAFVPGGITLDAENKKGGPRPGLRLKEMRISGPVPSGPTRVELQGFDLTIPFIRTAAPGGSIIARDMALGIAKGEVVLRFFFPAETSLTANLNLGDLRLSGKNQFEIKQLSVPNLHFSATDVALNERALFGITASIDLDESLVLETLNAPSKTTVSQLQHSMRAQVVMHPSPTLTAHVKQITFSTPSLTLKTPSHNPISTGVEMEAEVEGLNIEKLNPFQFDLQRLRARVSAGDFFQADIKALAHHSGLKRLDTSGQITLDLKKLTTLLPKAIKPKGVFKGKVEVGWNFKGRRPDNREISRLTKQDIPMPERVRDMDFIEDLEITTKVKDLGVALTLKPGSSFRAAQINSTLPLKLHFKNGLSRTSLEGKLLFGRIDELPIPLKLRKPLLTTLSFSGAAENLRDLQFSETLQIETLGIRQSLDISLSRIDRLLGVWDKPGLPLLLGKLEGSLVAAVKADLGPALSQYTKGISLEGPLKAGIEIRLDGERQLSARSSLESEGLNISMENRLNIKDLHANINLEKQVKILSSVEEGTPVKAAISPLSVEVLQPRKSPLSRTPETIRTRMARRLMEDLQGLIANRPSLSFDSAHIETGTLPLDISSFEMEFRLPRSLPSIDYFQFEMMGGTSVGAVSISRDRDLFILDMDCTFSGLDADRLSPFSLLPGPAKGSSQTRENLPGDTELSGELSLRLPISEDPDQALNNLSAALRLTHIGSRTLERFLYAIDPYESNETISRQRNILRQGIPRWIDLEIRHGNLSLTGEVEVKGMSVQLPPIERFNVTALPLRRKLEKNLSSFGPVVKALKALSADVIMMQGGRMRFISSDPKPR